MKRYVRCSSEIDDELKGLVDDILYQEYENNGKYAEVEFEDILDSVVDHVNLILFEMDEDGVHADLASAVENDPPKYNDLIRDYTYELIDNYPWTVLYE